MDPRTRILLAAAELFGEAGYRGATTRRIADRAGVNEVTLFRHFGSKGELIREAIRSVRPPAAAGALPQEPRDLRAELIGWAERHLAHLRSVRSLIRTCMGESEEHPDIMESAASHPVRVRAELVKYLRAAQACGLADRSVQADVAAALLMGALFTDAMGRDVMPDMFDYSEAEAPRLYVDLMMRALSATVAARGPNGGADE